MQGVGFRPYVYRLAARARARRATCSTTSAACCSRSRATPTAVERFLAAAAGRGAAAGARSSRVACDAAAADRRARLRASSRAPHGGEPDAPVAADAATCADCLAELFDPADRRYRYPFVNCTELRPALHDRARRALRPAADDDGRLRDVRRRCQAEYDDPRDRRFHAQPNACPDCGPARAARGRRPATTRVAPRRGARCATARSSPSRASAATTSPAAPTTRRAVARLRARKHREDRPFALMARDVATARGAGRAGRGRGGAAGRPRAADRARAAARRTRPWRRRSPRARASSA